MSSFPRHHKAFYCCHYSPFSAGDMQVFFKITFRLQSDAHFPGCKPHWAQWDLLPRVDTQRLVLCFSPSIRSSRQHIEGHSFFANPLWCYYLSQMIYLELVTWWISWSWSKILVTVARWPVCHVPKVNHRESTSSQQIPPQPLHSSILPKPFRVSLYYGLPNCINEEDDSYLISPSEKGTQPKHTRPWNN